MMNNETEAYLQIQPIERMPLPLLDAESIKQRYIRRTRRQRLTRAIGCLVGLLAAASPWWLGTRPFRANIAESSPANADVEIPQSFASQWQENFSADLEQFHRSADGLSEAIRAEEYIQEIHQANAQYVQHVRNRAAYDYWVHQSDLASH